MTRKFMPIPSHSTRSDSFLGPAKSPNSTLAKSRSVSAVGMYSACLCCAVRVLTEA